MLGGHEAFQRVLVSMGAIPSLDETFKKSEEEAVKKMKDEVNKKMEEFIKVAKPAVDSFTKYVNSLESFDQRVGEIKDQLGYIATKQDQLVLLLNWADAAHQETIAEQMFKHIKETLNKQENLIK